MAINHCVHVYVCVCEDVARDSYDEDEDEGEYEEEGAMAAMEPSRDRHALIEKYHVSEPLVMSTN